MRMCLCGRPIEDTGKRICAFCEMNEILEAEKQAQIDQMYEDLEADREQQEYEDVMHAYQIARRNRNGQHSAEIEAFGRPLNQGKVWRPRKDS